MSQPTTADEHWRTVTDRLIAMPRHVPAATDLLEGLKRTLGSLWFARATSPEARRPIASPLLDDRDPRLPGVLDALRETYYRKSDPAFLASPEGQQTVRHQVVDRYNDCVRWIVPWVMRHTDLRSTNLVELGCGTGSSTAAFAPVCKSVTGYDIEDISVEAAQRRSDALGVTNARYVLEPPSTLVRRMASDHPAGVEAILAYAVFEHTTFEERTESLRACWDLLRPGGLFIIADTPNRLTYNDTHTSLLPFFDMLPQEVAIEYANRSQRREFVDAMAGTGAHRFGSKEMTLTRWGRGISYHDFELALGPIWDCVVGDGFDPEIVDVKPLVLEEVLLAIWMEREAKQVPPAFYRRSIDVILRKPG